MFIFSQQSSTCLGSGMAPGGLLYGNHFSLILDLTLPMLRLLSSKAQGHKDFLKPSKPGHFGIHWIALAEYSQMSTHVPGFQLFFCFFASFCIGKISRQQHKG